MDVWHCLEHLDLGRDPGPLRSLPAKVGPWRTERYSTRSHVGSFSCFSFVCLPCLHSSFMCPFRRLLAFDALETSLRALQGSNAAPGDGLAPTSDPKDLETDSSSLSTRRPRHIVSAELARKRRPCSCSWRRGRMPRGGPEILAVLVSATRR